MNFCISLRGLAVLPLVVLAACTLPDQSLLPPNVRLSAYSSGMDAVIDQYNGAKLTVTDPNAPIDFAAEGFSSLVGLARVELRFNLSVGCWVSGDRLVVTNLAMPPLVASWSPSDPVMLHGFIEHTLEQAGLCRRIGIGGRDAGISGFVWMSATSRSGLTTQSKQLLIDNPS